MKSKSQRTETRLKAVIDLVQKSGRGQFGVLLACAMLSIVEFGCSTVQVQTTTDPQTDFSKFNTFNFAEGSQSPGQLHLTQQNRLRIQDAVAAEMARRACRLVSEPELLFYFDLGTAVEAYNRSNPTVESGSMRANLGREYGLQYDKNLGDHAQVNYIEGTLSFRVFDAKQNRLIWQGQAVGVLYQNRPDQEVQDRIQRVVKGVFAKFPIRPK
jgi:hypothetical protein